MHGSKPVGCAFAKKLSMAGTNASNFKRTFTFQFIQSTSLFGIFILLISQYEYILKYVIDYVLLSSHPEQTTFAGIK